MQNKYTGTCKCGKSVPAHTGTIEKIGRKWEVTCATCAFDKQDHSSYEDRECGDRAYEDRCADMCGYGL